MRNLDDGPDGLNDAAFDRALGIERTARKAKTASCSGCRDRLPTRPCAITGTPQHRGPDHTFACTAAR